MKHRFSPIGRLNKVVPRGTSCYTFTLSLGPFETETKPYETGLELYLYKTMEDAEIAYKLYKGKKSNSQKS